MPSRIELPASLVETARAFADGSRTPVEPRNAATVVLLRDGRDGDEPEIYLLSRHSTMAFAGGMCVFPGGGVDPRDFDAAIGWAGPDPGEWADRLGVDEQMARALVCAAVRETFEESGVLLAGRGPEDVVADTTGADWEADRRALEGKELAFTEFMARRELVLRSDLLGVWAGWLTPVFEPRRFRTWFFVAALPAGQRTRDVSTESSSVAWMAASAALVAVDAGEIMMLPPTYLTCLEVGRQNSPAGVLREARHRSVQMFTPALVEEDGRPVLSVPEHLKVLLAERS